ncbi:hypothetical protein [Yoonia maritima]|uniref:hypothetical protein n=1 Tax=Yoonia maritima TaxID=1435347 RepID=UPI0010575DC0|nr:hypothetical protein [Yoonia maritima]
MLSLERQSRSGFGNCRAKTYAAVNAMSDRPLEFDASVETFGVFVRACFDVFLNAKKNSAPAKDVNPTPINRAATPAPKAMFNAMYIDVVRNPRPARPNKQAANASKTDHSNLRA